MNILHYSLGLPPYRTGGLTKYSVDLMEEEATKGNEVFLLYPGQINIVYNKTRIKQNPNYKKIHIFELINPLPVPLIYGVKDIKKFIKTCDTDIFINFFKKNNIDCIHIHTFMGLPREFMIAANHLKIKIVFTSHDYYGLCPKSSLYNTNYRNCDGYNNRECSKCCTNALSYKKIIILQSHLYKMIKDHKYVSKIRNNKKNIINSQNIRKKNSKVSNYEELKQYYYSMFKYVDVFHFNSTNTYEIYSKHIKINNYRIIPITHKDIKDNRSEYSENKKTNIIKIGYLGPQTIDKGFFSVIKVLDRIKNPNIKLSVYFKPNINRDYLEVHERYKYNEIRGIFKSNDIIIMPSLSNDTFGFVVLEALSYGTPVIVSKNVGAKEIINNAVTGYVYKDEEDLSNILKKINIKEIERLNTGILMEDKIIIGLSEHTDEIIKLYSKEK